MSQIHYPKWKKHQVCPHHDQTSSFPIFSWCSWKKWILLPKLVYAVSSRGKVSVARVIEPTPYRLYGEFVCGDTSLTRWVERPVEAALSPGLLPLDAIPLRQKTLYVVVGFPWQGSLLAELGLWLILCSPHCLLKLWTLSLKWPRTKWAPGRLVVQLWSTALGDNLITCFHIFFSKPSLNNILTSRSSCLEVYNN